VYYKNKKLKDLLYPLTEIDNEVLILGGKYSVNRKGEVFNKQTNKSLKPWLNSHGYLTSDFFYQKDKGIRILHHRLMAGAFIPNPENKPQVNHIDGNRSNNALDNLEWVTASENTQHSYDSLNKVNGNKGKLHFRKVPIKDRTGIARLSKSGEKTQRELAKEYGVSHPTICNIVKKYSELPI
jgi:hypothetical protein